jgi:hypothetical protein
MKIRTTFVCFFLLSLFCGAAAAAEQPSSSTDDGEQGLTFGARPGFGVPYGTLDGKAALGDSMAGIIPIWVDAYYRLGPHVYAGAYAQFAYGLVKDCRAGSSCSAQNFRFGPNIHVHPAPYGTIDPWLGVGLGYEILWMNESNAIGKSAVTLSGFEFVNLQVGADFVTSRPGVKAGGRLGPFASGSLGRYSDRTVALEGVAKDTGSAGAALHGWLTFGVRGAVDL